LPGPAKSAIVAGAPEDPRGGDTPMEPLMAYLHYLAILVTASFLVAELVLCRPPLAAAHVRLLPRLDVVFFVAALAALATGLLRLFFYAKGPGFYLPSPAFWAKMGLYVAIALLSISPTLSFMRWRRALDDGGTGPDAGDVRRVRRLVHAELGLLALMPLMAVLMARGVGR
jgi:putative membrane protein